MKVVEQERGGEAVAGSEIGLELEKVAATDQVIGIGVGGEFGNVDVVVFGLDAVEEPDLIADDGAGERKPRF